jgi:PPOX class probable F420-dependent enzyme
MASPTTSTTHRARLIGRWELEENLMNVIPASHRDLLERPLFAHLATVRPDGTPQVNPTWFRFDGTHLWLTTTTSRRKSVNWQLHPDVALSIIDPERPYRYLEVRGRVDRVEPDPDAVEFFRLADRYGFDEPDPYADAANRVAVAIRPLHTTYQW